jgi:hypothetical protein
MYEPWQLWEIRNPDGGATGLELARARVGVVGQVLLHAAPERIDIDVMNSEGTVETRGRNLHADGATPISRITIDGDRMIRENIWPGDADLGTVVILPGGEAGVLTAWWHADDRRSWRWSVELSNSLD